MNRGINAFRMFFNPSLAINDESLPMLLSGPNPCIFVILPREISQRMGAGAREASGNHFGGARLRAVSEFSEFFRNQAFPKNTRRQHILTESRHMKGHKKPLLPFSDRARKLLAHDPGTALQVGQPRKSSDVLLNVFLEKPGNVGHDV